MVVAIAFRLTAVIAHAMAEAAITHEYATEAKLRFVQLALARGADPNCPCEVYGL